jgi:FkbM family methyltransferase
MPCGNLIVEGARLFGRLPFDNAVKHRFLHRVYQRYKRKDPGFEITLFGCRFRGSVDNLIDYLIYFHGSFEPEVLSLLRRIARHQATAGRRTVFYGQHTLFMARYADRVYAFEPLPKHWRRLSSTIEANRLPHVEVAPLALGNVEQELAFYPPTGFNQGCGSFVPGHDVSNRGMPLRLPVVRGDDFIARMGLRPPTLIKVDAEGFDRQVLEGLRETIGRHRPVVFLDLIPPAREQFGSERELRAHFYADHVIKSVHPKPFGRTYRLDELCFTADSPLLVVLPREDAASFGWC